VQTAAPAAAKELRQIAKELPEKLDEIGEEVEHASDAEQMRAAAKRLRELAREKEGLVARTQQAISAAAAAVESAQPAGETLAGDLRRASGAIAQVAPSIAKALDAAAVAVAAGADTQSITDEHMKRTRASRAKTADWAPELAASHATGGTPERDALFAYVRELFGHPLDTTWWEPAVLGWVALPGNLQRLEAYIKVRNSGKIHHHH
jgi:hypothetical protein